MLHGIIIVVIVGENRTWSPGAGWEIMAQNSEHPLKNVGILSSLT